MPNCGAAAWRLTLATLGALCACAPSPEPPVQVMALVRSGGSGGTYQPTQVALRTVTDTVALEGAVARLIGGARIDVDPRDPLLQLNGGNLTDEQLLQVFLKEPGRSPRAHFVSKDGVLWPADFHTWNLVTTYYNFEQAFDHFQAVGVPGGTLGQVPVYYFPDFRLREVSARPQQDNALYFSPVKAFVVLPFEELQATPLSINGGIVAHEYAHLIWSREVMGDAALPQVFGRWTTTASVNVNILKSLDEGLADFHAYAASCRTAFGCDPRFMSSSFNEAQADARDISRQDLCLTDGLRNTLVTLGVNEFTGRSFHYAVGSALASSLYHAGSGPEDWEQLSGNIVSAYRDTDVRGLAELINENLESPQNFSLEAALDVLLAHIPSPELRTKVCSQFLGRLRVAREHMPHCPGTAAAAQTGCPQ